MSKKKAEKQQKKVAKKVAAKKKKIKKEKKDRRYYSKDKNLSVVRVYTIFVTITARNHCRTGKKSKNAPKIVPPDAKKAKVEKIDPKIKIEKI